MLRKEPLFTVVAVLLLALPAAEAAADWLVLGDGGRVETQGPWEVRGKLVVFTTTEGQLASMRLTDVDLDASRAATEAATRAAEAPPEPEPEPEPRKATFILTDADVSHGDAAEGTPATGEETAADATAAGERLVVTQWQEGEMPGQEGIRLSGTLQNRGENAATRVRLTALLYDAEGSLVATGEAQLSSSVLMPDRQVRFQVDFPGVFAMSAARFEATSLDFDAGSPEGVEPETPPGGAAEEPGGEEPGDQSG